MKLKIFAAFVFGLALTGFKTGEFGTVDIFYNFETTDIASGPDTFELFEHTSSDVSLSSEYAFRGAYSLHIRDRLSNGSFPEFQGYFPQVDGGIVEIGFALMTPAPEEPFNVAMAGDGHFNLSKDGLGFWLINDAGTLRHLSDSIPKRLFTLTAYQWYWFEISLDITKGEYSLRINDEFGLTLIDLKDQKNPINAKNSSVNKYSFIGDIEDQGNANLYIDNFALRTDYADSPKPLLAPGRRALFIDKWNDYHKTIENLDFCLPAKVPYDFLDIYNTDGFDELKSNLEVFQSLLSSPTPDYLASFRHESTLLTGIAKWADGCRLLREDDYSNAIKQFEDARDFIGNTPATQLSLAIAYANNAQHYAAQATISLGQSHWPNDTRWLIASAATGFIFNRIDNSENALSSVANSIELDQSSSQSLMRDLGWLRNPAAAKLRSELTWSPKAEGLIIAEQYYFSLLWQKRYTEAETYAQEIVELLADFEIRSELWIERAGDAALLSLNLERAERKYLSALRYQKERISVLQKLADVYFLDNRADEERRVRESIYGALNYER